MVELPRVSLSRISTSSNDLVTLWRFAGAVASGSSCTRPAELDDLLRPLMAVERLEVEKVCSFGPSDVFDFERFIGGLAAGVSAALAWFPSIEGGAKFSSNEEESDDSELELLFDRVKT